MNNDKHCKAALLSGALITLGVVMVLDTIVAHWLLGLHRAVPGPWALTVEVGIVLLGAVLFSLGLWREARRRSHL